jgi:hypothetical protein
MKKILVVLLAILVTGGLFAQITFTGDVKTGLHITQSSDEYAADNDPKVDLWHDDAGQRFYLEGKVDFDDDFGVAFGFVGLPDADINSHQVGNAVKYDYARLYGEFLNDMLRITVGSTTGGVWGTGGRLDTTFDDLKGIKLEVKPIAGLDIGFQLRTEPAGDMTVEQWLKETVIGAKYDSDLFSAVVAFGLDSDYSGGWYGKNDYDTPIDATDPDDKGDEGKQMRVLLGVDVKVVPNLEAKLQAWIKGLGDLDKRGVAAIGQNLGYQITPALKAGAGFTEKLNLRGDDYKNEDLSTFRFEAEPYVNYKLSDLITLDLNIPFAMGWTDSDPGTPKDPLNPTPAEYQSARNALDLSYQIGVKPAATFTLNTHASINTYYKFQIAQYKDVPDGMKDDAVIDHTVQVSFAWTF